nr:unnamed protein product [Callosobruchus analis]
MSLSGSCNCLIRCSLLFSERMRSSTDEAVLGRHRPHS